MDRRKYRQKLQAGIYFLDIRRTSSKIVDMAEVSVSVGEFLKEKFSSPGNVQAVLAGASADVLHVWVMIDQWNPIVRKQVYAIQKAVMKQLLDLNFDFHVIDLPCGVNPSDMVSGTPVIFTRADQRSTPKDCSR